MDEPTEVPITWTQLANLYPIEVAWIVQRYGPSPDGNIQQKDYERYRDAYDQAHHLS